MEIKTPPTDSLLALIQLDTTAETPLYRQIYAQMRRAILARQFAAGMKLPSTRDLAALLGVSRNTVLNAIEQLLAEGYLEARMGSGTYVTGNLPPSEAKGTPPAADSTSPLSSRRLSAVAQRYAAAQMTFAQAPPLPRFLDELFVVGLPDLRAFPFDLWMRLAARVTRRLESYAFGQRQGPGGYMPLRQAIAEYVRTARAVRCEPEQIIITSGSQQALFLAAHVLLDAGDVIWIEEPGYMGARAAFYGIGAKMERIPVDQSGLDVEAGISRAPQARLAYVSPSHQFPLGYTLSLARRLKLLKWAEENDMWIIEDDYDSEYRYSNTPLESLQGLDENARVIYVGTFSKVLFPGLRLGYLVVPPDLVEAFMAARWAIDLFPPIIEQATLTEFIREGHFVRHLRRTRRHYADKRDVLVDELQRQLGGLIEFGPLETGMHMTVFFNGPVNDKAVTKRAREVDVVALPLSMFHRMAPPRTALVLGYAGAAVEVIRPGVRRLARVIEQEIAAPS